jgi:uncharacterized membrane protein
VQANDIIEITGKVLDVAGVIVIAAGTLIAFLALGRRFMRTRRLTDVYRPFRQGVGRAILLGLELLVAADIIRTVAVSPTFQSLGGLAVIVAVRTFLSFSLEVELTGRWPWQAAQSGAAGAGSREPGGRPAQP